MDSNFVMAAEAAKRQYVGQFASVLVTNTYLRIAVIALCGVSLALVALNFKTYQAFRDLKPLVIRINDVGRAEAVGYQTFEYKPQERELKYFLTDFVERHYGRMRATVRENYTRSLYFLDGRLADTTIESNNKTNVIETFLTSRTDEIDVHVTSVSIEDLRQAPYHAVVDFEETYYANGTRDEVKREKHIANVVFVVKDHVPNSMIPVNPLGLTITYLHDDQTFQ